MQKGTFPTNLRTFEGLKTKRAKNGNLFGSCFQIFSIFWLKIGNLSILVTQLAYHTFLSPSVIIIYFSTKNTHFYAGACGFSVIWVLKLFLETKKPLI